MTVVITGIIASLVAANPDNPETGLAMAFTVGDDGWRNSDCDWLA